MRFLVWIVFLTLGVEVLVRGGILPGSFMTPLTYFTVTLPEKFHDYAADFKAPTPPLHELADPNDLLKGKSKIGTGTGFFVRSNGLIVTNKHVIEQCDSIYVSNKDGVSPARLFAVSNRADLALLGLKSTKSLSDGKPLFLKSEPSPGKEIYIWGFPSADLAPKGTFTTGVVTSETFSPEFFAPKKFAEDSLFTHNAQTQPGSSGSGVFDKHGNLVGVTFASISQSLFYAVQSGVLFQDMNVGVKAEEIAGLGIKLGYAADEESFVYSLKRFLTPDTIEISEKLKTLTVQVHCIGTASLQLAEKNSPEDLSTIYLAKFYRIPVEKLRVVMEITGNQGEKFERHCSPYGGNRRLCFIGLIYSLTPEVAYERIKRSEKCVVSGQPAYKILECQRGALTG